ncbi:MAG TPA: SDR family oxidoreductase [Thermoanaerobaculia bacterium]|nr:SDR family oxidoreductase [Thermoanaerobaculia bacterium]
MTRFDDSETPGRPGLQLPADPREGYPETHGGPPDQDQPWPGHTDAMRPRPDHGEQSYRGSGRLSGRAALVTGGDSGIGRAVAIAFAREGADVAVGHFPGDGEAEEAEETLRWVREAGREGVAVAADLRQSDECRRLVDEAAEALGRLDVLVNNAAYQQGHSDFATLPVEQIERTFRTNILAYVLVARAAVRHLPAGGVILNTGSVTAFDGNPALVDYSATKGAIHTFTKSLALSLAERGIRVNCVAPGPVWTPLIPATLDGIGEFGADTRWKRPAQPVEIATSFVFLASEDGRFYTGEVLAPTGSTTSR